MWLLLCLCVCVHVRGYSSILAAAAAARAAGASAEKCNKLSAIFYAEYRCSINTACEACTACVSVRRYIVSQRCHVTCDTDLHDVIYECLECIPEIHNCSWQ